MRNVKKLALVISAMLLLTILAACSNFGLVESYKSVKAVSLPAGAAVRDFSYFETSPIVSYSVTENGKEKAGLMNVLTGKTGALYENYVTLHFGILKYSVLEKEGEPLKYGLADINGDLLEGALFKKVDFSHYSGFRVSTVIADGDEYIYDGKTLTKVFDSKSAFFPSSRELLGVTENYFFYTDDSDNLLAVSRKGVLEYIYENILEPDEFEYSIIGKNKVMFSAVFELPDDAAEYDYFMPGEGKIIHITYIIDASKKTVKTHKQSGDDLLIMPSSKYSDLNWAQREIPKKFANDVYALFYKADGKRLTGEIYSAILSAGLKVKHKFSGEGLTFINENRYLIENNNYYTIVNPSGKVIAYTDFDDYSESRAVFYVSSGTKFLYGVLDADGKQVVAPEYSNIMPFFGGHALAQKTSADGLKQYFSINGKYEATEIVVPAGSTVDTTYKGFYVIRDDNGAKLYNYAMEEVTGVYSFDGFNYHMPGTSARAVFISYYATKADFDSDKLNYLLMK